MTIATATGVTLVGNMVVNDGPANFRVRRLSSSTVSVTRLEKANYSTGIMIVRDEKSSGTEAGTFTSGAWRTRDLNDVIFNAIDGASLGASDNRVTLPAGVFLVTASAPGFDVDRHQIKLVNITNSSDLIIGSSSQTSAADTVQTNTLLVGVITLTEAKALEVQHQCTTTRAVNGFGIAGSFGVEVYTQIKIEKIG